jgi:acetyltransferase (GNAT) family protein
MPVAVRLPQFASEAVRCAAVQAGDQRAGELSYWLLPDARGRGLALSAVTAMMKIAVNAGLSRWSLTSRRETLGRYAWPSVWARHDEAQRGHRDRFGGDGTMVVHVLSLGESGGRRRRFALAGERRFSVGRSRGGGV